MLGKMAFGLSGSDFKPLLYFTLYERGVLKLGLEYSGGVSTVGARIPNTF